jgi:predicted Zn-dependent peptidase
MEDLDAASLEDVEQFFRTYYAPNNAVLTICGDFEPAQARELVAKHFGDLPRGPDIPPIPGRTTLEPTLGGEVRETVYQDVSLPRVYTSYRIPPFGTDEYYTALVTSYILGYGKAALLYRTLVREQQLAQDIVAYAFPIVVGASMLVIWATARPGRSAAEIERGITEQFERLRDVEDADVERAVSLLAAERLNELQRLDERADQLSMYTQLFDDPERINTEVDRIRAVTPQLVRDFAARYLGTDNRAVLTYVPREVGA